MWATVNVRWQVAIQGLLHHFLCWWLVLMSAVGAVICVKYDQAHQDDGRHATPRRQSLGQDAYKRINVVNHEQMSRNVSHVPC